MSKQKGNRNQNDTTKPEKHMKEKQENDNGRRAGAIEAELIPKISHKFFKYSQKLLTGGLAEVKNRLNERYPEATPCIYECICTECFSPMSFMTRELSMEELGAILQHAVCFNCLSRKKDAREGKQFGKA